MLRGPTIQKFVSGVLGIQYDSARKYLAECNKNYLYDSAAVRMLHKNLYVSASGRITHKNLYDSAILFFRPAQVFRPKKIISGTLKKCNWPNHILKFLRFGRIRLVAGVRVFE